MKAVIYARYSSDTQREESIEGQIRECTEYAKYNDMEIVGTYIDRAYSARTDHRPEFQRMIKDSEKKQFDVVLVWKLDRFARDRFDSAHYKRILKKNGARVISAKETISQGAEGILMESMLEGMAEYYSAELSEKTKRGMKENALKCKVNGVVVPLGYMEDSEHRFAIDEAYAPIVREVFALYLDGKGYKQIAQFLAEKGVRQKNGKPITPNVVYTMLRNRKYIGEYKFGDTIIENGVPRIVSDDMFSAVQNKIAQNKKAPARKKAIDEYLLTTKLFCGECGAMMVGESGHSMTGRIYQYYRCVHTKKVKTCGKKPVRKDWIENLVIQEALRILNDREIVEQLADRLYEMQGEESTYLQSLRRSLPETQKSLLNVMKAIEQGIITETTKARLEELEAEQSRSLPETQKSLLNVMKAIEQGIITETTKARLEELEAEQKKLEGEIGAEQLRHPRMSRDEIVFGIERFASLDVTTHEGRQKLIDGFINSVFLYDDRIVLNFNGTREARTLTLAEVKSSGSADKPQLCKTPVEVGSMSARQQVFY